MERFALEAAVLKPHKLGGMLLYVNFIFVSQTYMS